MIPTVLISWKDRVYRPAGYRIPLEGELYVSKDGKLKTGQKSSNLIDLRLILREYSNEDFSKKKKGDL